MCSRQGTPQQEQLPLPANILAIIMPKNNVSQQTLQITDGGVTNISGLGLTRVINSRPPKPISVCVVLGASDAQPGRVGFSKLGYITKGVTVIRKIHQIIETPKTHAMVCVKHAE